MLTFGGKMLKVGDGALKVTGEPVPQDEVQIGNQIWKSKNLAIDDGQGGIYTQTVNYGQGDVVEYYYNWYAANRIANSISGWHLPTTAEWDTLATTVGDKAGTKLKSTYGWTSGNGTDDYGFTALPDGRRGLSSFYDLGKIAWFWAADSKSSAAAYSSYIASANLITNYGSNKTRDYYSVRLVKDA